MTLNTTRAGRMEYANANHPGHWACQVASDANRLEDALIVAEARAEQAERLVAWLRSGGEPPPVNPWSAFNQYWERFGGREFEEGKP